MMAGTGPDFGSLQVEVRDPDASPAEVSSIDGCERTFYDRLDHTVRWRAGQRAAALEIVAYTQRRGCRHGAVPVLHI